MSNLSSKRLTSSALTLGVLFFLSATASAQVDENVELERGKATTAEQASENVSDAATGSVGDRAQFGSFDPTIQLTRSDDGTTLAFGISTGSSEILGDNKRKISPGEKVRFRTDRFNFVGEVPIDRDASDDAFAFGSITGGTTARIGWTRYVSSFNLAEVQETGGVLAQFRYTNPATMKCIELQTDAWVNGQQDPKAARKLADDFLRELPAELQKQIDVEQAEISNVQLALLEGKFAAGGAVGAKELAGSLQTKCAIGKGEFTNEEQLITKYLGRDFAIKEAKFNETDGPLILFGFNSSIGLEDFDFIDRPSFTINSVNRFDFQSEAFLGLLDYRNGWSLRASATFTSDYSAAENVMVCQNDAMDMMEVCLDGADGAPKRAQDAFASVEARKVLDFGKDGKFRLAISPRVTMDVDDQEFGIDVPIYFIPNKDGKLNAGIRFGYRTDQDEFGLGIFVDAPFALSGS